MKSGIKYVDGMDLHGVIKAGLEDFELEYTGCKSADMILENGGNIDGIAISLCDFTDKGFLKENASQIFRDAMSVADRYNAYIVIDTANVKKASVLEQIIDECVNEIGRRGCGSTTPQPPAHSSESRGGTEIDYSAFSATAASFFLARAFSSQSLPSAKRETM